MTGNRSERGQIEAVRAYYRALDGDDYELLAEVLAPDFTQVRPDTTLEGRDRFVRFMREERPMTDTTHPIDAVYRQHDGEEVVVRGRLLDSDGDRVVDFVDVFEFDEEGIAELRTYTA